VVKLLLKKGAAMDSKDNGVGPPLSHAAENWHEAVVKLLLEKGAAVDSKDGGGQIPLSRAAEYAAWSRHKAVVELLKSKIQ
jgi:ankyrin repeat protein